MAKKPPSAVSAELLDELLAGQDPATVLTADGVLGDLKKALAERMLNAEMDVHLGSEAEQQSGNPQWQLAEDGIERRRRAGVVDPTGSARPLRSGADSQVPAPVPGLR